MKKVYSILLTTLIVMLAAGIFLSEYYTYLTNPWTRDGQVATHIIEIAPRISGPIVKLAVKDNQFVKKDDLLFRIDQSIFKIKLEAAKANLQKTKNELVELEKDIEVTREQVNIAQSKVNDAQAIVEKAQAIFTDSTNEFERKTKLLQSGVIAQKDFDESKTRHEVSDAELKNYQTRLTQAKYSLKIARESLNKAIAARGKTGKNNAKLLLAKYRLKLAKLNLEYTNVRAPTAGYISNLQLRVGTQLVADKPVMALIDSSSYWIYGFFQENEVASMISGDKAIITLMTYPDTPLQGEVESIGWGISRDNGSQGNNLLINVNPTFAWIRLAQRIPVKIKLINTPDNIKLRTGTTASVLVKTQTQ